VTAATGWQIRAVDLPSPNHRTRIVIVDDHASVRAGLRFLLSHESEFEIVGEAFSVDTALSTIEALKPEIVVLDFGLGAEHADRVLDALAAQPNAPQVLMLSMEDERVVGQELVRRGAAAYVMKQSPTAEILAALHRLRSARLAGEPGAGNAQPASTVPPTVRLTKREREVLLLIKEGLPSKTIARRLQISEKTVDVHKHHLRRKFHLQKEIELVRHAALFAAEDLSAK